MYKMYKMYVFLQKSKMQAIGKRKKNSILNLSPEHSFKNSVIRISVK